MSSHVGSTRFGMIGGGGGTGFFSFGGGLGVGAGDTFLLDEEASFFTSSEIVSCGGGAFFDSTLLGVGFMSLCGGAERDNFCDAEGAIDVTEAVSSSSMSMISFPFSSRLISPASTVLRLTERKKLVQPDRFEAVESTIAFEAVVSVSSSTVSGLAKASSRTLSLGVIPSAVTSSATVTEPVSEGSPTEVDAV